MHALDWSPNGRYLGIAKVARDQSTEILVLDRQANQLRSIKREVGISDYVVAVDDDGRGYYERFATPSTLIREGTETRTWALEEAGYLAFDWTPNGAWALVLHEPGGSETLGLVSVGLDNGLVEREVDIWPVAGIADLAVSADGRTQVVAHADEIGGETTLSVRGEERHDINIGRYGFGPVALTPAPTGDWLIRYNRTDTGSIHSIDTAGQAGPELSFDFTASSWDFAADGAYAVSPFSGSADQTRVCIVTGDG